VSERDYVLGTHDAEIARLRLQHRAGITQGQTVVDVGCGPGYAALDLAEIVGPKGRVIAVERSARFLDALRDAAKHDALDNIVTVEADITEGSLPDMPADAAWCRWVFSWLTKPERGVANIARALKPGGVAVFHEYLDYGTWALAPRSDAFAELVQAIIASVEKTGANIDSAVRLPRLLEDAGFEIVSLTPIVDIVGPENYVWQWPTSFARDFHTKLVDDGLITAERANDALADIARAEKEPGTRMITPMVLEIVARRRAAQRTSEGFKTLLASAPLEGLDLSRPRDFGREINFDDEDIDPKSPPG
jgi:ubiquinone/menaquinone biosynthesis C-methylase UbiE